MKLLRLSCTLLVLFVAASCASVPVAPPTLTPRATTAFKNTQAIAVLDLIRDTAIDANKQVPPLVSDETTRAIVQYHETTIKLMNASVDGWADVALTGMTELTKHLLPGESSTLGIYLSLGATTLKGLLR